MKRREEERRRTGKRQACNFSELGIRPRRKGRSSWACGQYCHLSVDITLLPKKQTSIFEPQSRESLEEELPMKGTFMLGYISFTPTLLTLEDLAS